MYAINTIDTTDNMINMVIQNNSRTEKVLDDNIFTISDEDKDDKMEWDWKLSDKNTYTSLPSIRSISVLEYVMSKCSL